MPWGGGGDGAAAIDDDPCAITHDVRDGDQQQSWTWPRTRRESERGGPHGGDANNPMEPLRACVEALGRARPVAWAPVFAFIFDEFWMLGHRLTDLAHALIGGRSGPGIRWLPDLWVFHLRYEQERRAEAEARQRARELEQATHGMDSPPPPPPPPAFEPETADDGDVRENGTRKEQQGWGPHRDRLIEMGFRPFAPDGSPASLNFWVPLTRATPRNGCMYAVPRSKDGCYNNTDCEAHFGYLHGTTNNRVPGAGSGRAFPDNFTAGFSLQDVRALPRVPGEVMAWDGQLLHWGGRVSGHTGVEMTPDNGGGSGGGGDNDRISIAFEFQRADWPSMNMFSNPVLLPGVDMPFAERLETIARQFRNFVHIRSNRGPGLELLSAMVPKLLEQRRAAAESAEKADV